ncbi:MAG TPA: hypothetical protein VFQ00_04535 [Terriglobales bacterium]|nr:hypothetical protein [Terriglobales bacterium]
MVRSSSGVLLLSLVFSLPSFARNHGISVNIDSNEPVTSCDQLHMRTWDNQEIARSEERVTLPGTSSTVSADASRNGGIYVYGEDRQDFQVLNCKAAVSNDQGSAEYKLQQIKMSSDGGRLTVSGPEDGDWVSYLIIHAPRTSSLALSGENGPISVSDVSGKLDVHEINGPFAVKNSGGEITAQVRNGPISYSGTGGDVHLRAENGPVSVRLGGSSWNGKGLEAHSENGPLSVKLPNHYTSGVLVETSGYSPFHCSGCEGARRDFDDNNKSVQFGSGEPVIRMSTTNGPVSIDSDEME